MILVIAILPEHGIFTSLSVEPRGALHKLTPTEFDETKISNLDSPYLLFVTQSYL